MNLHQEFLQFNGQNIIFGRNNGEYYIALKPILDALNLSANRYIKRTKRDPFFSTCLDTMSVQVGKNDKNHTRKMTCLPEKYIYGWICSLNSDDKNLIEYKKTCYDILYKHFHGTITNRRELLLERNAVENEIGHIKQALKEQDQTYKKLEKLIKKRKNINTLLNSIDQDIVKQPTLFDNGMFRF